MYKLVSTSFKSSGGGSAEFGTDVVPSAGISGTGASCGSQRMSSPFGRPCEGGVGSDSFAEAALRRFGFSASSDGGPVGSGGAAEATSWGSSSCNSELDSVRAEVTEDDKRFESRGAAAPAGSLRGYRATRVDEISAR